MNDMNELEMRLKRWSEGIEPPEGMRERVKQALRREAASGNTSGGGGWWGYAAGMAATLLIGANLAVTGASGVYFEGSTLQENAEPAAALRSAAAWQKTIEQLLRDGQS